jgi:hypothetical protein
MALCGCCWQALERLAVRTLASQVAHHQQRRLFGSVTYHHTVWAPAHDCSDPVLWQVRYAFVAGVVLTLALIPVNRYLALKIQAASSVMMGAKDARVRIMSQALRGIRVLKMICWEPACVLAVGGRRMSGLTAGTGLTMPAYL